MELDYSQGYSPTPNTIFRKEANLSMRESATLTYLLSHREGFKVSYRRISKDLHSDFRTVKKVIEKLKTKGYEAIINKVLLNYNTLTPKCSNNNTFNKNSNTSSTNKKLQHFLNNKPISQEKASLKNFTQNKVLEHISGGAVVLQRGCCNVSNTRLIIKNNNKELIKANLKIIIGKKDKRTYPCIPKEDLPVFEYVEDTSIKEQPITINKDITLETTALSPTPKPSLVTHNLTEVVPKATTSLKKLVKEVKATYEATPALELPLSLTAEFFKVAKTINPTLDLDHEYQLFRANKIKKNHSNTNWINAWKSWLENGLTKYKKGNPSMHYVKENQPIDSPAMELLENQEDIHLNECTALIEEAKNWLYNVDYQLSKEHSTLFFKKLQLERTKPSLRTPQQQREIDMIKKSLSTIEWKKLEKRMDYKERLSKYQTIINAHKLSSWHDLEIEYIAYCDKLYQEIQK